MITHKKEGHEVVITPYQLLLVVSYAVVDFNVFVALSYFGVKLSADHLFDAIQQQNLL